MPDSAFSNATMGPLALRAGAIDEVITRCGAPVRECRALNHPIRHARARLCLGTALAAKGEHERACEALGGLVRWWSSATRRSVNVDEAKRRMRELECAPP